MLTTRDEPPLDVASGVLDVTPSHVTDVMLPPFIATTTIKLSQRQTDDHICFYS